MEGSMGKIEGIDADYVGRRPVRSRARMATQKKNVSCIIFLKIWHEQSYRP